MVGIKRLIQEARNLEPSSPTEPTVPSGSPLSTATATTSPAIQPGTITTPLPDANILESTTTKLQGTNINPSLLEQTGDSKQELGNEQSETSQTSGSDTPQVQLLSPADPAVPSEGAGETAESKPQPGSQAQSDSKTDANDSNEPKTENKTADTVAQSSDDIAQSSDDIAQSEPNPEQSRDDVNVADNAGAGNQSENNENKQDSSPSAKDNSGSLDNQSSQEHVS